MTRTAPPVGGFFELELCGRENGGYHKKAVALSTGRACISLLLTEIQPKKCYLPYYCCDALYEPFNKLNIDYEFYGIDENLNPKSLPTLRKNEYFLYVNYFGIKNAEVERLITIFGPHVIIDDTHNFFHYGYEGIWSFTSARKYFPVPDGAYLYSPKTVKNNFDRFTDISVEHNLRRFVGTYSCAYSKYVEYENTLNSDIYKISLYSERVLSSVDYETVIETRRSNFNFYKSLLDGYNELETPLEGNAVPFCYPFLADKYIDKAIFHQRNYFIPCYWPDVSARERDAFQADVRTSRNLIPLPIDHRYSAAELEPLARFLIEVALAHE